MSLKNAFVKDERYVRASWVNIINIVFHELTGINVILIYSNTILVKIIGDDSSGFTPRQGTYVIGLVNLLSSLVSVFTIKTFGRRFLLLWGHLFITICHFCIGLFIIIDFNYGTLSFICLFLFVYQNSTGPIAWTYAAETCSDITLGVGIYTLWTVVLIETLFTETLMNSALQP